VKRVATLISAALVASALAGCGSSAPNPRSELSDFVVHYAENDEGNCCDPGMHAKVSTATFARSNPRWASVVIAVTDSDGQPDGHENLVLRKVGSTWHVIGFGTGAIGCGVPDRIRDELAVGIPRADLDCSY
jgi:hypothetical protein